MRGSSTTDDIGLGVALDIVHQGDTTGVLVKELFDSRSMEGQQEESRDYN